jgi:hypothetical protein
MSPKYKKTQYLTTTTTEKKNNDNTNNNNNTTTSSSSSQNDETASRRGGGLQAPDPSPFDWSNLQNSPDVNQTQSRLKTPTKQQQQSQPDSSNSNSKPPESPKSQSGSQSGNNNSKRVTTWTRTEEPNHFVSSYSASFRSPVKKSSKKSSKLSTSTDMTASPTTTTTSSSFSPSTTKTTADSSLKRGQLRYEKELKSAEPIIPTSASSPSSSAGPIRSTTQEMYSLTPKKKPEPKKPQQVNPNMMTATQEQFAAPPKEAYIQALSPPQLPSYERKKSVTASTTSSSSNSSKSPSNTGTTNGHYLRGTYNPKHAAIWEGSLNLFGQ